MHARILVVEDSPTEAEALDKLLSAHGYEVQVASTGGDALRMLRSDPFDVALVDTSLPDLSGLELLRLIRLDPRTRQIVVILLSPAPTDQDLHFGYRYYSDAHLPKPVHVMELVTFLSRVTGPGLRAQEGSDRFSTLSAQWDLERNETEVLP